MIPISPMQAGDLFAMYLAKHSIDLATLKQIATETGYNDSPWFGARQKKVRLVGEVATVNTALVIFAVNQVFTGQDAEHIIDAFLASARKSVFSIIEAKDRDFRCRYEQRLTEYFKALRQDQPGLGVSFIFMNGLDLDPLSNLKGQVLTAARFGQSLSDSLSVLRTFALTATGIDAIQQLRALARGST